MTLTPGLAAVHQSILGDRLRLPLDAELSAAVTGLPAPLAHPGLVCDVAIGQSTLATQHVKANLFYRGLMFFRFPAIGDTLFTRTEVVGLKKNSAKPGRAPTGLMALRITTIDQADRLILDFYRCAMLPLSPGADPDAADHADDLSKIGADLAAPPSAAADWNGEVFRERVPGPHFDAGLAGIGAAQQRRCSQQRTGTGPPYFEYCWLCIMIRASVDVAWSMAGTPSGWRWRRPASCCRTWRPYWAGSPATTPRRCTRATPSTASCTSNPPSRPTAAGFWDCGRWSTRSATCRTSHAKSWTGVSPRCSSDMGEHSVKGQGAAAGTVVAPPLHIDRMSRCGVECVDVDALSV